MDPDRKPTESSPTAPAPASPEAPEARVVAVQERLAVDTHTAETGAVRIRKLVSEEVHSVPVRLCSQSVEVRRVPVNQPVEQQSEPRWEGDTLIIPVYEYVPVVTTKLILKEEVHVTTRATETDSVHEVQLKSEKIVVERRDGADGPWRPDAED
ncbi:YsnF/AvaK domain-containing protein [Paraburkholderia sp. LEh10]|uniref:YsnF/AvaK domain-containing protein n=1 Tax=Paraburkholderia sp. LEh10 TaxID=2821353 RepID=UPI001AE11E37|nr:YsnF/AvaK domain-containing protein [Paraburkholderia sp. LEh10]MBP0588268.1 YsnF/AvaK domain-containing protein [Paraburkholderia sp. LEh10]